MTSFRFIDDWKQDKQIDVYRYLKKKLGEDLTREAAVSVEPVVLSKSVEEATERRKVRGLLTGFRTLDSHDMFGGLHPGSLYVVGGNTGVGKTLFVCNLVLQTVLNSASKTLFLTTEMPHWAITERLIRIWESIMPEDTENFLDLPISYVDNQVEVSIELIRSLIQRGDYGLVVVDNLQWFSRGGANIAESTGLATQSLKKLAIEFNLPIVLVSHLNRESYRQNDPDMNNLKGSSYIEQDADGVIILSRNTDNDERGQYPSDTILVSVRKNRLTGNLTRFLLQSDKNNLLREVQEWQAKTH